MCQSIETILLGETQGGEEIKGEDLTAMSMPGELQIESSRSARINEGTVLQQEGETLFPCREEFLFRTGMVGRRIIDTDEDQAGKNDFFLIAQDSESSLSEKIEGSFQSSVDFMVAGHRIFPQRGSQ